MQTEESYTDEEIERLVELLIDQLISDGVEHDGADSHDSVVANIGELVLEF